MPPCFCVSRGNKRVTDKRVPTCVIYPFEKSKSEIAIKRLRVFSETFYCRLQPVDYFPIFRCGLFSFLTEQRLFLREQRLVLPNSTFSLR